MAAESHSRASSCRVTSADGHEHLGPCSLGVEGHSRGWSPRVRSRVQIGRSREGSPLDSAGGERSSSFGNRPFGGGAWRTRRQPGQGTVFLAGGTACSKARTAEALLFRVQRRAGGGNKVWGGREAGLGDSLGRWVVQAGTAIFYSKHKASAERFKQGLAWYCDGCFQ